MTLHRRLLTTIAALCAVSSGLWAQQVKDFKPSLDSMRVLMLERTTVDAVVKASKVVKRGSALDFYMTSGFGDYPWREEDVKWFKSTLKKLLPSQFAGCSVGNLYVAGKAISGYVMPESDDSGKPVSARFRTRDPKGLEPFITKVGEQSFQKGMTGRNIALWQSHGLYYEEKTQRWEWQRAPVFQTVEDMYTQSYVLPFLIPMLENAGAYVMTPRERDVQTQEIIADNDPAFTSGRGKNVRSEGRYTETGTWADAGTGFADTKAVYTGCDNPFTFGTARQADCADRRNDKAAEACWTPDIPKRDSYAVYISYKSLPNSTNCAHYTVKHLGGTSEFLVNQKMGGGTWIYLGTFEFDKGSKGCVVLDNEIPEGQEVARNAVITADAVRFGGGMGKIGRGLPDQNVSEYTTSGMPSFTEGAYYWIQWAGVDSTILKLHPNDYTSDYADRGAWVGWMSGGSRTNPKGKGLGIPVDMSFAFHSDAGTTPNDSIIGTLSIYTLLCDGSSKLPNGEDRLQQRMYADFVQSQIVDDIRKTYNPEWNRRGLWDRSYSESRTTTVPAMLLELLSHQNFADMKFGLDPSFRFAVSRAVYKGMLKYLSSRFGCDYAVQPLPVNSFSTSFRTAPATGTAAQIKLSWKATDDPLESTAKPTGFILQTRIDDGAFDEGYALENVKYAGGKYSAEITVRPGHIYSYRIIAFNEGGKSFPSETLSLGVPSKVKGRSVLVVNNFTRVSAPSWFDTPDYAGFTNNLDAGVPYIREINFIGDQYQFRRELPWVDDDNPGFGASFTDQAGKPVPGNTFDFTLIHGKALMAAGRPFHSTSSAAFADGGFSAANDPVADFICGKQVTTMVGSGKVANRFQVFPEQLQEAIVNYTGDGGNILISGANIGTDVWDKVFPVEVDSAYTAKTKAFIENTLGYKWLTNFATHGETVWPMKNNTFNLAGKIGKIEFHKERNSLIYNAETPDGIVPANEKAHTFLRYKDTNISAGTCYIGEGYRTACLGFPIEVIKSQSDIDDLIANILEFFDSTN